MAAYGHAPRLILGAKMLQESGSSSGSGVSGSGAGASKGPAVLKLVSERFEFVRTQEAMKVQIAIETRTEGVMSGPNMGVCCC